MPLQNGFAITCLNEVMLRGYFFNELITRKVMQAITRLTEKKNKTETFVNLSEREMEFLKLACIELAYKKIAEKMFVSVRTIEGYCDALCEKLGLKTRVGMALYAIKNGILVL